VKNSPLELFATNLKHTKMVSFLLALNSGFRGGKTLFPTKSVGGYVLDKKTRKRWKRPSVNKDAKAFKGEKRLHMGKVEKCNNKSAPKKNKGKNQGESLKKGRCFGPRRWKNTSTAK